MSHKSYVHQSMTEDERFRAVSLRTYDIQARRHPLQQEIHGIHAIFMTDILRMRFIHSLPCKMGAK